MRANAAEKAEHRLHEDRRLDQAAVEEMPQRVKMADVIAFDLEAGVVLGAGGENELDVGERVLEEALAGPFEIRFFPVVFELAFEAGDHRIKPEVHRAHIERGNFRLEGSCGLDALFHRHGRRAAGGEVDHHIRALLDYLENGKERLRRLVRPAILRVPGMQLNNGGAGLSGADGGVGDLLGGDRQMRRH